MIDTKLVGVDNVELVPMRSCCVCRSVLPKRNLNRIVLNATSDAIHFSLSSKAGLLSKESLPQNSILEKSLQGRGLYYCIYSECSSSFNEQKFAKILYGSIIRTYLKLHSKSKVLPVSGSKKEHRASHVVDNSSVGTLQPSLIIFNDISLEFNFRNLSHIVFM